MEKASCLGGKVKNTQREVKILSESRDCFFLFSSSLFGIRCLALIVRSVS